MEPRMRVLRNAAATSIQIHKQSCRGLHLTRALRISPDNVTEIKIPVPWGHIAGKWWGNTKEQPILALHGWQDNAGSFDPLLELLPDSKPVLAIDSPGHGFSSHHPEGMLYHNANYVMACRRIQRYFKWEKKMTVLGHSEGGIIAFLFSAIYPEFVHNLITLDVVKPFAPRYRSKLGEMIDTCVTKSRRDSGKNKKYSLEEIQDRWLSGTKGSLTVDAVKILLKRGAKLDHDSGKFTLTRDPKLKVHSLQMFEENQSLELARNLQCHYLAFRCSGSKSFEVSLKNSPNFISTITESTKSFKIVDVEGTHHVHLNNPERVASIISAFIKNTNL